MYLEGGPDCADAARCAQVLRSGGGTNAALPATLEAYFAGDWSGAALLDPSPAANPVLSGASVAYVPYCTADFHAGTRTAPVNGTYWFGGHHVVLAAVEFVLARGAGAAGRRLLLAGGSSGGMGTVRNIDAVRARIARGAPGPSALVLGVALGGFYFYQRPYTGPGAVPVGMDFSEAGFRRAFGTHRAFVPPGCRAALAAAPWLCSQANGSLPYVHAPVFFAEALTDRVVTANHAGLPVLTRAVLYPNGTQPHNAALLRYVARYTGWMQAALRLRIVRNVSAYQSKFDKKHAFHMAFWTSAGERVWLDIAHKVTKQ